MPKPHGGPGWAPATPAPAAKVAVPSAIARAEAQVKRLMFMSSFPSGVHGFPTCEGYLAKLCNRYAAIRWVLGVVQCIRLTCA